MACISWSDSLGRRVCVCVSADVCPQPFLLCPCRKGGFVQRPAPLVSHPRALLIGFIVGELLIACNPGD